MITGFRKYAYITSVLAIACFFLFPEPNTALIGALLLQTLAYIMIAGHSIADREPYFIEIQPWILVTGIVVFITGLLLMHRSGQRGR